MPFYVYNNLLCISVRGNSILTTMILIKKTNCISQIHVNFNSFKFHYRELSLEKTFLMQHVK